mmetsp:Transcript_116080/g.227719  ORF Transcript_116080/g.227719 Transcript_116080/m.227719 type:complete len:234 (+) Transcript_116080:328-1029(+)
MPSQSVRRTPSHKDEPQPLLWKSTSALSLRPPVTDHELPRCPELVKHRQGLVARPIYRINQVADADRCALPGTVEVPDEPVRDVCDDQRSAPEGHLKIHAQVLLGAAAVESGLEELRRRKWRHGVMQGVRSCLRGEPAQVGAARRLALGVGNARVGLVPVFALARLEGLPKRGVAQSVFLVDLSVNGLVIGLGLHAVGDGSSSCIVAARHCCKCAHRADCGANNRRRKRGMGC